MSTDSNDFDSWLKENLYRDIVFRSIIWSTISYATGYLAILYRGIKPIEYFSGMAKPLMQLINTVGTFSLLLCVLALMLKDLEVTLSCPIRINATRGLLGGFVRRLAGDLSLWTLGAFLTVATTTMLVMFNSNMNRSDYVLVGLLLLLLSVFIVFIAAANVLVRRKIPTGLEHKINDPRIIAVIYLVVLIILISILLFFAKT